MRNAAAFCPSGQNKYDSLPGRRGFGATGLFFRVDLRELIGGEDHQSRL
jgi:hypothetical protein